jgi:hypothetical protein
MRLLLTGGVRDHLLSQMGHRPSKNAAASTTSSPPTPSLGDRAGELHEIFAPPSDSPEPINDLLAAEMGRLNIFSEGGATNSFGADMVRMPRQLGIGGSRGPLRVPGQGKL